MGRRSRPRRGVPTAVRRKGSRQEMRCSAAGRDAIGSLRQPSTRDAPSLRSLTTPTGYAMVDAYRHPWLDTVETRQLQ